MKITGIKRDFVLCCTWQAAKYLSFKIQVDAEMTSFLI